MPIVGTSFYKLFWITLLTFCSALLGFIALMLPVVIMDMLPYPAPAFPLVRTAIEELSFVSLLLLFTAGFVIGLFDATRPILYGLASMFIFAVIAVVEKDMDFFSHDPLTREMLYYCLISVAAMLGVYAARYFNWRWAKSLVGDLK